MLKFVGWVALGYVVCVLVAALSAYIMCRVSNKNNKMADEDWEVIALISVLGPIGILILLAAMVGA